MNNCLEPELLLAYHNYIPNKSSSKDLSPQDYGPNTIQANFYFLIEDEFKIDFPLKGSSYLFIPCVSLRWTHCVSQACLFRL